MVDAHDDPADADRDDGPAVDDPRSGDPDDGDPAAAGRNSRRDGGDPDSDRAVDPEPADPVLEELFAVIERRKATRPADSYTASLLDGEDAALEKVGEEATELILAAKDGDRAAIAHESADLVYHLLVVLAANDVDLADLRAELRERR